MTNYKLTNLNDKTPDAEQKKLIGMLKAIDGVNDVKLHAAKSEFSLGFRVSPPPNREIIEKAVTKAGFTMGK